jgi:multidrug efflux pump subunit AcrA (membrane-fusion protein)
MTGMQALFVHRFWRGGLAVAFLVSAASCAKASPPRPTALPRVAAGRATQGTVRPSEQLAGIIAPYQNVAIQSTLAEPALEVAVQEGDTVGRGETLAQLDTADLRANLAADVATAESNSANTAKTVYQGGLSIAQGVDALGSAQAALRQAQANLQRDSTDLSRDRALASQGYISAQQLQQQQTTVDNDRQAVTAAVAGVQSARSNVTANGTLQSGGVQSAGVQQSRAMVDVALAQAQQERVQIAKATIVSPIEGVVVNRNLNPGEYPGTRQIFTLQQVDPIYAILRGSGTQIALVAQGAAVTVASTDLHRSYRGKVVAVLNQLQPGSTDFQVKVQLRNPRGTLRPGMAVAGIVSLPPITGVRVPQTAFTDDTHSAVLTLTQDDTVHMSAVAERGGDDKMSVVTGLPAGTRVVTNGQSGVGEGQKVAVQ